MKRMTVRDVRQKWPEAERALAIEGEIVVTRDSKPVAKLVAFKMPQDSSRMRFDPVAHLRWMRRFWKGRRLPSIDAELARERDDRA